MGAFKPIWQPVDSGEPIIEAFGGLDLDYINERYRIYDPALGRLVEKPWADIVNNRSLPAGRTYWDQNGVLQTAAADAPVIEYDPATGEKLGNRIWGSYGNVIWPSDDDSSSRWLAVAGATKTAAAPLPTPAGGSSNNVFSAAVGGILRFTGPVLSGSVYVSFFIYIVAKGDGTHIGVDYGDGNITYIDISGLTLNAWHKLSVVVTAGSLAWFDLIVRIGASTAVASNWSLRVSAAHATASSAATPYVATTSSAVTIPAESQIIDGQNFLDLWNASEGAVYIQSGPSSGNVSFGRIFEVRGESVQDAVRAQNNGTSGDVATVTRLSTDLGQNVFNNFPGAYASGGKFYLSYGPVVKHAFAGSLGSTANSGVAPPVNKLAIGAGSDAGFPGNLHIRRLIVLRKALPASMLQRITQL